MLFSSISLLLSAASGSAQVIADPASSTRTNVLEDQIDITGGAISSSEANLFHSFEQFDITAEQTANFITTDSISNVIGRVNSDAVSSIDGTLRVSGSEANLYLLNPAGILIGPNAQLNLSGGFAATTAENIDFENDGTVSILQFNKTGSAIVNRGALSVGQGEFIRLVGNSVVNEGTLSASQGSIVIVAVEDGNTLRLQQSGQILSLEMENPYADVAIEDLLDIATIGEQLTGGETNQATMLITEADGTVRLGGLLETVGNTGGSIHVIGNQVALIDANLDASGYTRGGLIQVGGGYKGEGSVPNASRTWVNENSVISADATVSGDGGNVIVWASDTSEYHGNLSARGGIAAGDGGFAEVSGRRNLISTGSFDLSAVNGEFGTLLLDPLHIEITDGVARRSNASVFSSEYVESVSDNSHVIWEADGDIDIHDISDNDLEFDYRRSVTFRTDVDNFLGGEFRMDPNDTIRAERGDITIEGAGIVLGTIDTRTNVGLPGDRTDIEGGDITLDSDQGVSAIALLTNGSLAGDISITGTEIDVGIIDTHTDAHSSSIRELAAGDVTLISDGHIAIESIDTRAIGPSINTAGTVLIEGRNSISVGGIAATSTGNRHAEIMLTGDQINLTGGPDSVGGEAIQFRPFTRSQSINLGDRPIAGELNLTDTDLAAIDNSSIDQIVVGYVDGLRAGTVTLSESVANTRFSRPEIDVVGSETIVGLISSSRNPTTFLLTGAGAGQIEDSGVQFSSISRLEGSNGDDIFLPSDEFSASDFEQISGGSGFDTFNYENMQVPPSIVDLSQLKLRDIDSLIGPRPDATLVGEDRSNFWTIENADSGALNGMAFENFKLLVGGNREDIFNVENLAVPASFTVDGGEYLTTGNANNRIVAGNNNIVWELYEEDSGRLIQADSAVDFSNIQHLESIGSTSGDVTALFLQTTNSHNETAVGSITGSINSGDSSLSLVGDAISIGEDSSNQQPAVGGKGTLTILPESSETRVVLGGSTAAPNTLAVNDRLLAIGPDSFSSLVVGDSNQIGDIVLSEDILTGPSILFQTQGNVTTAGNSLASSNGSITIDSEGAIDAGSIDSHNSSVTLRAQGEINASAVRAGGGEVYITSSDDEVVVPGAIDTSGDDIGHDVLIEARTDILVGGLIDTSGGDRAGNVTLRSREGGITTAGIVTATGNELTDESGQVDLTSIDNIQLEFIDARGSSSHFGTNINIDTQDSVVVTGVVPNNGASITAAGADNGKIQVSYGNQSRSVYDFSISRQNILENSRESINAGISYINIDLDTIDLVNRGIRNNVDTTRALGLDVSTREEDQSFMMLETSIGAEFSRYLQATGTGIEPATVSIAKVQDTLKDIESATDAVTALVYVCFVPDAAAAESVGNLTERQLLPDDQLEVILIAQSGEPIVRRRWGVTRAQVEAMGQNLRRQVGNPFSKRSQYLAPAQQLYDWIMEPIVQDLEAHQISSIGFILDTGLRTLPLATLHDGERYLIEDYSIGLLPTFSLTSFDNSGVSRTSFDQTNVLAMGASQFEHQPDLPAVDVELNLIADELWQGQSFLNEDFVLENLSEQVKSKQYGVLHLATHANFNAEDLDGSYIQLWNERLSLTDVDTLNLSDADIELIVLSACNTALGDAASEYGFAGFAINAGSPSALASLWPVSDEGTLGFMSQFYSYLRDAPVKAEALRAAQARLLNGEVGIEDGYVYGPDKSSITYLPSLELSGRWDFSHPFYWSAFTMVGNPW